MSCCSSTSDNEVCVEVRDMNEIISEKNILELHARTPRTRNWAPFCFQNLKGCVSEVATRATATVITIEDVHRRLISSKPPTVCFDAGPAITGKRHKIIVVITKCPSVRTCVFERVVGVFFIV